MRLVLITPPAAAPISLAEAKAQCRVEYGDEDLLLQHYIDAATALLDGPAGILGRCLVSQQWRLELAALPTRVALPFPDSTVDQAMLHDGDGAPIAFDMIWQGLGTMFVPRAGIGRPATITVTAGYGSPAQVPVAIRQAMLLLVAHWFDHRDTAPDRSAMPMAVDALLAPFRRVHL